jgi:hypothetical protein
MDEPPVSRERSQQDRDAPLARDDPDWFGHQLGEEWEPEEPGIYRFVGASRSSPRGLEDRVEREANEQPETREPGRRWAPWRKH